MISSSSVSLSGHSASAPAYNLHLEDGRYISRGPLFTRTAASQLHSS